MATRREWLNSLLSRWADCGDIYARAMFGGHGLYLDGTMFALIADEVIYFKVDASNRDDYLQMGSQAFIYSGKGKPITMSYYELPDTVLEDISKLHSWIEKAHTAALQGKQKSTPSRRKKTPLFD
jgi:DNA transformation protein